MSEPLHEKCAVIGVIGTDLEAARLAFYGLWSLQHRGQESSGIVSSDSAMLHYHGGPGLVSTVYHEEDLEQLPGSLAIGHNRYSTSGAADGSHCQPVLKRVRQFAFAHNGNLPTTDRLQNFLEEHGIPTGNINDSEMMAELIDWFMNEGVTLEDAVIKAFPLFDGVFSAVAMDTDTLVAFRDTYGVRPLSIGKLDGGYVVASETCAFDTLGAVFVRDVRPGEVVVIKNGELTSRQVVRGSEKLDIFEIVYFARPDSLLLGQRVNEIRRNFGRQLARELSLKADVVIPVPDSAIPMASGFSEASGIPFEMGLVKNRYIHRTFIRPTAELRDNDLKMKLNPVPETMAGKRVVLLDDSIVRGTTTKKIVSLLYNAGAKEVHVLISSPPIKYPDFYGINIPNQDDLIGARMTVDEIRDHMGADSLKFLSYEGMLKATGLPAHKFTTSCFNGIYPVSIGKRVNDFVKVA